MRITYTGRHIDLAPAQVRNIEEQFGKVAKLLDGKTRNGAGEQEAHVRLSQERHLHHAEVTVNFHHHSLVSVGTAPVLETAIHGAIEKLETQAIKVTKKWSGAKRAPKDNGAELAE
jgi:putative sigma-54 modulation protein